MLLPTIKALHEYIHSSASFMIKLLKIMSRRMEFSADKFSRTLGHGQHLCAALIKIGKDNLALPVDDPLYSMFNHSHPSIPERITAIKEKND